MDLFSFYTAIGLIITQLIMSIYGTYFLIRSKDEGFKYLSLLLIIAFIVQIMQISLKLLGYEPYWLFFVYPPIEYVLIVLYLISLEKKYSEIIKIFSVGIGLVIILTMPIVIGNIPVVSLVLQYLTLTIFCARIFYQSDTLIIAGLLLFSSLETVVLASFILPDLELPKLFQAIINIVSNIIIIIGLYERRLHIVNSCSNSDNSIDNVAVILQK